MNSRNFCQNFHTVLKLHLQYSVEKWEIFREINLLVTALSSKTIAFTKFYNKSIKNFSNFHTSKAQLCENFRILLPLWFYVKSILTILETSNFDFKLEVLHLNLSKICKNSKSYAAKVRSQNVRFGIFKITKNDFT